MGNSGQFGYLKNIQKRAIKYNQMTTSLDELTYFLLWFWWTLILIIIILSLPYATRVKMVKITQTCYKPDNFLLLRQSKEDTVGHWGKRFSTPSVPGKSETKTYGDHSNSNLFKWFIQIVCLNIKFKSHLVTVFYVSLQQWINSKRK